MSPRKTYKSPKRPDWRRIEAITDEQIAVAVASDPDAAPLIGAEWIKGAKPVAPVRSARRCKP
jgi:hypothetical protein